MAGPNWSSNCVRAVTEPCVPPEGPELSADHTPFLHRASLLAGTLPAIVNDPATKRAGPLLSMSEAIGPASPLSCWGRPDQFVPSHFARPLAGISVGPLKTASNCPVT